MNPLHDVLLNQLQRLNIDLMKESQDSPWRKLMEIISHTYKDYDEYRYAMERSLEIASEEIDHIHTQYENDLNKINTVSFDGIITTDMDWKITSLNARGEVLLKAENAQCANDLLTKHFMFLNAQKEPLDFNRLKEHFECGNSYNCKKGVIINLNSQAHEIFSSFTIAPFYLNKKLNSYLIIFRDITQDQIKEYDGLLNHLNHESFIRNKEIDFLTCAQTVLSNNHNGAFASELNRYVDNNTSQQIEHYILSHAIESNIHSLNHIALRTAQLSNQQSVFLLDNVLADMSQRISELTTTPNIHLESNVHYPITGDVHQFEQLVFEICILLMKLFKSSTVNQLVFSMIETSINIKPWVALQIKLKSSHPLKPEIIQSHVEQMRKTLSSERIDSITIDQNDHVLAMRLILKFPGLIEGPASLAPKASYLRCLFYLEPNSPLLAQMKNHYLINQLDYVEVSCAEDAVKKIKEGRLNKCDFNVMISDIKDFTQLEHQVLREVTSYINDNFLGIIHLGETTQVLTDTPDLTLYSVPVTPTLQELRSVLYALRASYLQKTKLVTPLLTPLPEIKKNILFIDLESYSQILYLQLFEHIGLKVYLANADQIDANLTQETFDAVFINTHHDLSPLLPLLDAIKTHLGGLPIYLFAPPILDSELSQILTHQIDHYLIKPFSISELLILMQQRFAN